MKSPRVIVAGAGLSGLACAFDLARKGADVLILERSGRAGGVVGTVSRDGFLFETGPSAIQAGCEDFRRLCGDLGIADRLIVSPPAAGERYLLLGGRLRRVPSTPASFLLSDVLSISARFHVCTEIARRWKPPARGEPEPDLAAFLTERLGAEATRVLAGSFVRGVYAAELRELGAKSAFPRLWRACEERGGLLRGLLAARRGRGDLPGPAALLSFPRGLQELVDALVQALGTRVRPGMSVEGVERHGERLLVRTENGQRIECDRVVLAVPSPIAARILAPLDAAGVPVEHLRGVRHADLTLVHLGLERAELPRLPSGLGYLVPPPRSAPAPGAAEKEPRGLGTLFASNLFPGRAPEGCVAVSSFYPSSEIEGLDDRGIVELAGEELSRATGQAGRPRVRTAEIRRWKDVLPRYSPGHADRMAELGRALSRRLPGLHLAGSYVAGVSVDQVIRCGRATAQEILG